MQGTASKYNIWFLDTKDQPTAGYIVGKERLEITARSKGRWYEKASAAT
jgi:hypothetical protein